MSVVASLRPRQGRRGCGISARASPRAASTPISCTCFATAMRKPASRQPPSRLSSAAGAPRTVTPALAVRRERAPGALAFRARREFVERLNQRHTHPRDEHRAELWVDRVSAAVAFYEAAFGAVVVHRVGHDDEIVAQLAVGDARFWVASASSEIHRFSPEAIGGATSRTLLIVDDPKAGGRAGGRRRRQRDICGHQRPWLVARSDRRPVRPRVGDRQTDRRLAATLSSEQRSSLLAQDAPRPEPSFLPEAGPLPGCHPRE